MDKALDLIEKVLDNFNIGRAVIYTLATLFITGPLFMLASLILSGHTGQSISAQLLHDISLVRTHLIGIAIFSYMLSFTVVSAAYALFEQKFKSTALSNCSYSAAFDYINLKKSGALQWYVSEYIRFFEAAYYVPFGMSVGSVIFLIYIRILCCDYTGQSTWCFLFESPNFLIIYFFAVFLGMICWIKFVCVPIYRKCQDTLSDLIDDTCSHAKFSKK